MSGKELNWNLEVSNCTGIKLEYEYEINDSTVELNSNAP